MSPLSYILLIQLGYLIGSLSPSYFLVAIFISFLLFEKSIAILSTSFLIFGDFFSKFFGIYFGRTQIFQKSLEGSLAHLNACLLVGYLFLQFVSVPIPVYLAGAPLWPHAQNSYLWALMTT